MHACIHACIKVRTVPRWSAEAKHPLVLYLLNGNTRSLDPSTYWGWTHPTRKIFGIRNACLVDSTRWGPLTTKSGCIPSYTHLQPWLNRVCWGYNYLTTRAAPSCSWWLNQPIWKICSSNRIISPSRGENKAYLKHHQKFQVPKMEVLNLIRPLHTACIGKHPILGTWNVWWKQVATWISINLRGP